MGNKSGKLSEGSAFGSLGPTRRPALIRSLLEVIQQELLPLSRAAIEKGDRFYTVAILRKSDLSCVALGRDKSTTQNPTATAELSAIQSFFALPERPAAAECIFLCVSEPSPMALYQFALCGFDNFVFLLSHNESRSLAAEETAVPLNAIFSGATEDEGYHTSNEFWIAYRLMELIEKSEKKVEHLKTVEELKGQFAEMMNKEPSPATPPTPEKETANA